MPKSLTLLKAVRLRGLRTLAVVIVAAGEQNQTTRPTVLTVRSLELLTSHFIEGAGRRRGTNNNRIIIHSFQHELKVCYLAWDVAILVPHARCTLVGGDCNNRPVGPLLRELNKLIIERNEQPCMLQTIATYKAGQLISYWLREQDYNTNPSNQYDHEKNATAALGSADEWTPVNLLVALLQWYVYLFLSLYFNHCPGPSACSTFISAK